MTAQSDREVSAAVPVIRYAWAKVNFYLHVTGRRPDGYHEIDSLVVFVGIGDRVSFEPADGLSLHVEGPFANAVPNDAENLVLRAGQVLAAACAPDLGGRIGLQKNLPVAAGLGGGSGDAAAALAGLAALGGLAPTAGLLHEIALGLGADVPVCLFGRPAFVGGIGERLERAPPLPAGWMVIVNPGVPLATPRVYGARAGVFSSAERWTSAHTDIHALADHLAGLRNDLEEPARGLAPEIDQVLDCLAGTAGVLLSRLSGSGASCFGLFARPEEARAAAVQIAAERPHWWVAAAPMLHGPLNRPWSA